MLRKFNLILILGLTLISPPLHTKEISKDQKHLSSSLEEIAEEMNNLNSNLNLLSTTISNLVLGKKI